MDKPSTAPFLAESIQIRVLQCRHLRIPEKWVRHRSEAQYWKLYLNLEEGCGLWAGERYFDLLPDQLFVLPPLVPQRGACRKAVSHCFVHFDFFGLPLDSVQKAFPNAFFLSANARQRREFIEVTKTLPATSSLRASLKLQRLMLEIAEQLLDSLSPDQLKTLTVHQSDFDRLIPALERIHQHPAESLSNTALAALCHMSVNHFIRNFKASMRQTPVEYINHRRIHQAVNSLLYTDDTIDRIAEACGFQNRYYFSRVFVRHTGLPPATFRRERKACG